MKSKKFNAIKNRKTGNTIIKHEVDGRSVYFWFLKSTGEISVETVGGKLVDHRGWAYMANPNGGNGLRTQFPVTDMIVSEYKKAFKAFNIRNSTQVKKYYEKYGHRDDTKISPVTGRPLRKRRRVVVSQKTFGEIRSIKELKEVMQD